MQGKTVEVHLWRRSYSEVFDGRFAPAHYAPTWPSELLISEAVATIVPKRGTVQIAKGLFGKPQLLWPYRDWQFNVSHTARNWWCALACGVPLGCDAEQIGPHLDDLNDLSEWTPSERRYLELGCTGREGAARLWTLKEAYSKAFGYGLHICYANFGISLGQRLITVRDIDSVRREFGANLVCVLLAVDDERLAVAVRLAPQHSVLHIFTHGTDAELLADSGQHSLQQINVFSNNLQKTSTL